MTRPGRPPILETLRLPCRVAYGLEARAIPLPRLGYSTLASRFDPPSAPASWQKYRRTLFGEDERHTVLRIRATARGISRMQCAVRKVCAIVAATGGCTAVTRDLSGESGRIRKERRQQEPSLGRIAR